ncbi:MAG: tRNA (guanosine(37)-N1)-methyltransferase TrmD [Candidatus Yanofskybacteria bacterium]|nr:tRNA (guanosine(37)-N1)-methyltransferase TrmD [Candidatus Yanofskybacteria bacterium]
MIQFDVVTIFPEIFKGFVSESLLARGQKKKIIKISLHDLRKWTTDKHKTVDDKPYGGGVGMVMKIEPIFKAVKELNQESRIKNQGKKTRVVLFSPRGKKFNQEMAKKWTKLDQLIFVCGRYEGVDERVADYIADEVISVGDYVLNGGEVAAMAVIESVSRMVPGFIAKKESAQKSDHAQYTRPEVFIVGKKRLKVPKVLLSGDHKKIEEWRKKHL